MSDIPELIKATRIPDNPDAADVVEAYCKLREKVATHFGYRYATDCMCGRGGMGNTTAREGFRDDGYVFEFIRDAVVQAITRTALASTREEG